MSGTTAGDDDGGGAGRERDAEVVGERWDLERDASTDPRGDRVGVDDGADPPSHNDGGVGDGRSALAVTEHDDMLNNFEVLDISGTLTSRFRLDTVTDPSGGRQPRTAYAQRGGERGDGGGGGGATAASERNILRNVGGMDQVIRQEREDIIHKIVYVCVCVCACVCVCTHRIEFDHQFACVCACVFVCVYQGVGNCVVFDREKGECILAVKSLTSCC